MAQAADTPLPAELPAFGKDKPLAVPKITQQTLPNGLQVWVVPRNGIPRVDYVLAVRGAGFGADGPEAPGRAKLLAGLLSEGTTQRSSKQIAEAAQAMKRIDKANSPPNAKPNLKELGKAAVA